MHSYSDLSRTWSVFDETNDAGLPPTRERPDIRLNWLAPRLASLIERASEASALGLRARSAAMEAATEGRTREAAEAEASPRESERDMVPCE